MLASSHTIITDAKKKFIHKNSESLCCVSLIRCCATRTKEKRRRQKKLLYAIKIAFKLLNAQQSEILTEFCFCAVISLWKCMWDTLANFWQRFCAWSALRMVADAIRFVVMPDEIMSHRMCQLGAEIITVLVAINAACVVVRGTVHGFHLSIPEPSKDQSKGGFETEVFASFTPHLLSVVFAYCALQFRMSHLKALIFMDHGNSWYYFFDFYDCYLFFCNIFMLAEFRATKRKFLIFWMCRLRFNKCCSLTKIKNLMGTFLKSFWNDVTDAATN